MSNGAKPAASSTYRVLRTLGKRSQRSYAATRDDGSLVVVSRFARHASGDENAVDAGDEARFEDEELALLLRDARCLANHWHPNIARVRHVDLTNEALHIATELIDGVTLEDLLALARERRRDPGEPILSHAVLARIFLDVLSGLQALHGLRDARSAALGAFHGELCPANVVVGKDGVARLVSVFRPRPVTCTPASEGIGYAAPETLAADSLQDARVDLWAVGVMLWETLMEARLYEETIPARVAQRQREEEVPCPDARLGLVAMRALAFDPIRRTSAHDVATEIRSLAGTVATGSAVAQTVADLAGPIIRARRAELDARGRGEWSEPSAPKTTPSAPKTTPSAPKSEPSAPKTTPSAPKSEPSAPKTTPPACMSAREIRVVRPSDPDVETAYRRSPLIPLDRPLPPRLAGGRATPTPATPSAPPSRVPVPPPRTPAVMSALESPTVLDEEVDDDDLPGPRQSTPDDEYLGQLAAEALAAATATSDDLVEDVSDVEVEDVRNEDHAVGSTSSNETTDARSPTAHAPPRIPHAPPRIPHAPALISHAPALISHAPPLFAHAPPRIPHAPPRIPHAPARQPSTRTPFVVDLVAAIPALPANPTGRPAVPLRALYAVAAAAAVALLILGVVLVRRTPNEPTTASAPPATSELSVRAPTASAPLAASELSARAPTASAPLAASELSARAPTSSAPASSAPASSAAGPAGPRHAR